MAACSSTAAPPPSPPWTELPDDLTANILQRLHTEEILMGAQLVCSTWWRVCKDPAMWRVIDLDLRHYRRFRLKEFKNICLHAVDRSQGQLVGIKLTGLAVDLSINYATARAVEVFYSLYHSRQWFVILWYLRLRPVSPPSISYQDGDYDSDWSYDIYYSSDSC